MAPFFPSSPGEADILGGSAIISMNNVVIVCKCLYAMLEWVYRTVTDTHRQTNGENTMRKTGKMGKGGDGESGAWRVYIHTCMSKESLCFLLGLLAGLCLCVALFFSSSAASSSTSFLRPTGSSSWSFFPAIHGYDGKTERQRVCACMSVCACIYGEVERCLWRQIQTHTCIHTYAHTDNDAGSEGRGLMTFFSKAWTHSSTAPQHLPFVSLPGKYVYMCVHVYA